MTLEQDLLSLPSVSFENTAQLPDCSGIYFAIDSNQQVLYIGQAKNMAKRWRTGHHRHFEIAKHHENYPVRLAWLVWNEEDLNSAEKYFINCYRPSQNGTPVINEEVFPAETIFKQLIEEVRSLIVVYGLQEGTKVTLPKVYLHYNYENSGKNGFVAAMQRFKESNQDKWRNLKSKRMKDRKYRVAWTMRPGSREHKQIARLQSSYNNHWEIACNGVIVDITPVDAQDYKAYRSPENSKLRRLAGIKVRTLERPSKGLHEMVFDPIRLLWS